jgi:hypothetical protein
LASVILRRDSEPGPETGVCAIVVLYEDNSSRDAAIHLYQTLEKVFHEDLDFEITWCRFKYFNDPTVASEAAQIASQADLIIVAIQRAQDLPLEVKAWFERWLPNRESTEGALVLLQTSEEPPSPTISQTSYLYLLAQRANLDYLSLSNAAPSSPADGISDPNGPLKGTPLPIRSGEDQGEGSVHSQHYSRSGINE